MIVRTAAYIEVKLSDEFPNNAVFTYSLVKDGVLDPWCWLRRVRWSGYHTQHSELFEIIYTFMLMKSGIWLHCRRSLRNFAQLRHKWNSFYFDL